MGRSAWIKEIGADLRAALNFRAVLSFVANTKAALNPKQIIGLMVGVLMLAYTLPTALNVLINTSVSGNPAVAALWGLLPLLVVVAVIGWIWKG